MSSVDRMIVILNESQQPPIEFTNINLAFQTPEVDTPPEGQDWNTKLVLQGVLGRGYYGTAPVFYRRIPLSQLGSIEVRSDSGFTDAMIIDMINNLLGTSIGYDEIEPMTIPEIAVEESSVITITAKSTSLGWIGDTDITLYHGRPYFNSVIASRLLAVLKHDINNVNGLPYAKDLSYNLDFSSYRDALKRNPTNLYPVDVAALQDVTNKLGFPSWNSGRLFDYPTSQVADANKSFNRVAVVDLNSNGMVGPIYFHYNLFDE